MLKRLFFLLLLLSFSHFFSTPHLTVASNGMTGESNVLELDLLHPKDPLLNLSTDELKNDNVKIRFIGHESGTKGFRFTISSTIIEYDQFSPTNPIIRENTLALQNLSNPTYMIFGSEDTQLKDESGTFIPDTTCDNGACTEHVGALWDNTLSFGFGYRCENTMKTNCMSDFLNENQYKQFANESAKENPAIIMKGMRDTKPIGIDIFYKVNTAASQAKGIYTNTITYIAVPGY